MIEKATPDSEPNEAGSSEEHRELFLDLFARNGEPGDVRELQLTPPAQGTVLDPPHSPQSLAECGLTLMQVCDLALKDVYLHGNLLGVDIARHMRLPYPIVDEALKMLKAQKSIEVTSGDVIGMASYRFNLTDLGIRRAKEAFERCGYVGPAPVSLEQYVEQCRRQAVSLVECSPEALERAMEGIIIRDGLLSELGPAVCSGKSIFVYGPPGNGKTIVARALGRFLNEYGGDIYTPYAIQAENAVITVLDPTIHRTTDEIKHDSAGDEFLSETIDLRWRRTRRPVVITGGELTLEMLDLRYNSNSNFYNAPLHIKANGGVFLIDDFGRQLVSPRDLLNRWILPLEEHADYLTLSTGKKIEVPFEQLIIFSTNIDPDELVDAAFLRRIRHKIKIESPTRAVYEQIFGAACESQGLQHDPAVVRYLFETFYDQGQPPRSSDPRDLLEIVQSI